MFAPMSADDCRDIVSESCYAGITIARQNRRAERDFQQKHKARKHKLEFCQRQQRVCVCVWQRVQSSHGLLTTVAYQLGPAAAPVYALEGAVAMAGQVLGWLRDNMAVIHDLSHVESLAGAVPGTADLYFVPAFSGMYAPYWQQDARGVICGITEDTSQLHLLRAALEAVCFQARDVLDAMNQDCAVPLTCLQVDGGMTANNLMMQLQADLIGIPVVRSSMKEKTALGAAMAAGRAVGIQDVCRRVSSCSTQCDTFTPNITKEGESHCC
ncbi:hypothetical protein PR048_033034 [Dryococelus australis]|uniref:Carbohydrate kinase FGGY C-terminal domain-containing protein n=1 Tax=Dryococelus australis TaxID=614101 RepID=A0ABQ9G3X2_9NEOP|nr:hypothetical protein PR048_033034 [Dryococelus australis]